VPPRSPSLRLPATARPPPSGSGAITFTSWGEEYIEVELPTSAFEDGFSISYDKFLVLVGNISVADDAGTIAASDQRFFLLDHKEAGVKELVKFEGLAAGAYTVVSYETSPAARDAITPVGSVSEADADMMASMGLPRVRRGHAHRQHGLEDPSSGATASRPCSTTAKASATAQ
jgi:hypothetical protein